MGNVGVSAPNSLGIEFAKSQITGNGGGDINNVSTVSLTQSGDTIFATPGSTSVDIGQTTTGINVQYIEEIGGTTYINGESILNGDVAIPHTANFSHNPNNNSSFPSHNINANVQIGEPAFLPGFNPDVYIYPTTFQVGGTATEARTINLYSGAGGTTLTSVQGISLDAFVDVNVNSGGLLALDSGGATTINAGGAVTITAIGLVTITGADVVTSAVNSQENITGDKNLAAGAYTAEVATYDIFAVGNISLNAGAAATITTVGATLIDSVAGIALNAGAGVALDAVGVVSLAGSGITANAIAGVEMGGATMVNTFGSVQFVTPATTFVGNTVGLAGGNVLNTNYIAQGDSGSLSIEATDGIEFINVSSINGVQWSTPGAFTPWYQIPAESDVNINGLNIDNVGELRVSSIFGDGEQFPQLSIYAPSGMTLTSENISLATISSINGVVYVPTQNWSQTSAISTINANNNNLVNVLNASVSSINGYQFPQSFSSSWVSTAATSLNMSNFGIDNISSLNGQNFSGIVTNPLQNTLNANSNGIINLGNVTLSTNAAFAPTLSLGQVFFDGTMFQFSAPISVPLPGAGFGPINVIQNKALNANLGGATLPITYRYNTNYLQYYGRFTQTNPFGYYGQGSINVYQLASFGLNQSPTNFMAINPGAGIIQNVILNWAVIQVNISCTNMIIGSFPSSADYIMCGNGTADGLNGVAATITTPNTLKLIRNFVPYGDGAAFNQGAFSISFNLIKGVHYTNSDTTLDFFMAPSGTQNFGNIFGSSPPGSWFNWEIIGLM